MQRERERRCFVAVLVRTNLDVLVVESREAQSTGVLGPDVNQKGLRRTGGFGGSGENLGCCPGWSSSFFVRGFGRRMDVRVL
jgi:hypothetical protein